MEVHFFSVIKVHVIKIHKCYRKSIQKHPHGQSLIVPLENIRNGVREPKGVTFCVGTREKGREADGA